MASSTKEALGNALKKMLAVKPIDKITVKDLVEECGVNRQTFYYHFDDVYDLLEWVFNSQNRAYLLRYLKRRLHLVYHAFAAIVAEGQNVEWGDLEFICDFYVNGIVGIIAQWCDIGMPEIDENTKTRFYKILDNSTENLLARFKKD